MDLFAQLSFKWLKKKVKVIHHYFESIRAYKFKESVIYFDIDNPQGSNPYLILTMYDELIISKHVGLVRGDIFGKHTLHHHHHHHTFR